MLRFNVVLFYLRVFITWFIALLIKLILLYYITFICLGQIYIFFGCLKLKTIIVKDELNVGESYRRRVILSLHFTRQKIFWKIFLLAIPNRFGEVMDYDFRTRSGPSYDAQLPMHRPSPSSSPAMHAPSLYPKVGQLHGHAAVPSVARPSPQHQTYAPSTSCTALHLPPALILQFS